MRVSPLKKKEAASAAGMDLINICSTITADGNVSDEEIDLLKQWLDANQDADLPVIPVLRAIVINILADGKISDAERAQLHKNLERVLPKELRDIAIGNRRMAEANAAAEQILNSPAASFEFPVAGRFYEGRQKTITRFAKDIMPVRLIRDPNNEHSSNAVRVLLENDLDIGLVPESYAPEIARLLDEGYPQAAIIKTLWRPANDPNSPCPIITANFYATGSTIGTVWPSREFSSSGFKAASYTSDYGSTRAPSKRKSGCLGCLTLVGILILAGILLAAIV